MRKLSFSFVCLAICLFACISCEDDDSSSFREPTHEDSTVIVSLCYENYQNADDVTIESADSSVISVSNTLLQSLNVKEINPGNFIAVWTDLYGDPFYLRATSADVSGGRTIITGNRCEAFDAFEDVKIQFCSDMYYDSSQPKTRVGTCTSEQAINMMSPYTEYIESGDTDTIVIHPYVIIPPRELGQSNTEGGDLGNIYPILDDYDKPVIYVENLYNEGLLPDASEVTNGRWGFDVTTPKVSFDIPIYGGIAKNINGSIWSNLIKAEKEGLGKDQDSNPATLKIRLKNLSARLSGGFNCNVDWSWKPWKEKKIELFVDAGIGASLDTLGVVGGVAVNGEKVIWDWYTATYTFYIGPIPISIKFHPMLVFKYTIDSHAAVEYAIHFDAYAKRYLGVGASTKNGAYLINRSSPDTHFNVNIPSKFSEIYKYGRIALEGSAAAGINVRCGFLLAGCAGPTIGMGPSFNFDASIGADSDFDEYGQYIGGRSDCHLKGEIRLNGEVGGEISVLGKRLFNRAWDIKLYSWPLFDLNY